MPDNISKLYQELKGTYELGSENDFRKYLSDGNKREALRKELASDYEVGDSASFTKYLGLDTKPKTYNKAEDNVGASVGTAVFQNPRQTKKSTPQQGKPADTRTSMPNGFGELNMQQAQQIGLGKGPVSWEHPEMPDHQETVVEKQQRMLQGKATPQEQKQVQNRLQQLMDEIAYEQETGKRLRQPVLNTDFEAPTLSHDENGNPLIGNTTDQDRVSAHQQVMAEQAEWDSLSDEEKRERKKQMQLQMEMDEYEEPGFLGVTGKKLASGFINAGLGLLKTMEELTSGMIVEDASSPTGYSRTPDFDPNSNDAITSGLRNAGEYAERLSRQGEPRKGASFTDLLMSGDISGFLLKGWGTGMESAPMTLSAYNPYTMALNAISMAGNNYWQETMENPDIPTWKRATYAIGTAAIEQAVEKFADPVFKYIGGGMGKKVVQEVTEEAEKTIAKRIVNVLKDAAGEGAEEIITNFGNDTLGQALDWLDGASDYGLVAQWRDYKKQNPNASLSDFAFQKADETMNSFFGGALAGAYTSGGAQATVAGLQYAIGRTASPEQIMSNPNQPVHPATLDIAQSFDRGYGLEKDEDKTAAADKYSAYRSRAEAAVGEEVLNKIDANPTAALSEIGQLGLDEEGQRILGEYIGAKAEFDGIQQRIIEDNRASRPNYVVNGNNIDEVDAEGNVVNTHEYANEDEMKSGLWELQAKRDYQDMQADINMIRLNPKYDYDAMIGGFAEETGLDVDYIESILNKDPLELSDPESAMVSEFADLLHSILYDNTDVHEEQSTQDGAKLADAMSIDINDISEESAAQAQQLMNDLNASQQALNDAFAKNEDLKQEVESMEQQGMPHQGIIASLDSFRPAEVQAVIDFYNATAKFDGFRNQMAQKIDEEAANSTKRHTLNGTINGQADLGNIYTISDGTNEYYLVSGNITTDSATGRITGSDSGLIIGMDLDGSFVQIGDTNGYSLTPNVVSTAQFEEAERIRLQEAWSVAIDPNGAAQAATGQQATEQSGNAGGEAGATTGTGANEPPAPAPVQQPEVGNNQPENIPSQSNNATENIPQQPVVTIESVTDKDGIKRYENGIAVDDAIADITTDGFDVDEVADASIAEAQQTIDKINGKATKTRKDLMDKKKAQDVIDYYTQLKARWAEVNQPEGEPSGTVANSEESINNEPQPSQSEGNVVPSQAQGETQTGKPSGTLTVEEQKQERIKALKAELRELFDDDFTKANDVYELVSMWVGRKRNLAWDDVNGKRGLQKELGWQRKIGGDTKFIETLLAKKGEGMGVDEFVHMVWESPENDVNGEKRFSTEDIKEALLDLLTSARSKSDVVDHAVNTREQQARQTLEEQRQLEQEKLESGESLSNEEPIDIDWSDMPFPATMTDEEVANDEFLKHFDENGNYTYTTNDTERELSESSRLVSESESGRVDRENRESRGTDTESQLPVPPSVRGNLSEGGLGTSTEEETTASPQFGDSVDVGQRQASGASEVQAPVGEGGRTGEGSTSAESAVDPYLQPRDAKEEKIVADIDKQLQGEIFAQQVAVGIAKDHYDKKRQAESYRATDMFSDDEAFEAPDQLFSFDEMGGTDRSQEGVERRAKAEKDAWDAARAKLEQLQSPQERNSRIRGALDNHRRQTTIETDNPIEAIEQASQSFREEQEDKNYGKDNKLVTQDRYEELKKKMKQKLLGQLNAGFDPEIISIGAEMAMFHVEAGARKFADFARRMIDDLGDAIRPYLQGIYESAKRMPGMQELRKEMDSTETVDNFDVQNFDKTADQSVNEHKEENNEPENVVPLQGDSAEFVDRQKEIDRLSLFVHDILLQAALRGAEPAYDYETLGHVSIKTMSGVKSLADKLGLKDMSLTDLQELVEAQIVQVAREISETESLNEWQKFQNIVRLYQNQPTLSARDNDRINKQQYSTPAPMAFLMGQFLKAGKEVKSGLEPSAGNGMLTLALPKEVMHVNDIDEMRLSNLAKQGFAMVTSQDGTLPFEGKYDVVVTNPPFGSKTPKVYDGLYEISGLEHQMAINALESMKDDGRAAIIIGGNTEYNQNGTIKGKDRAFLNYLYAHYNVVDVINMNGHTLYSRQGTGYHVRMILINGRKEFNPRNFAPTIQKARAESILTYDELYKRVNDDILSDTNQSAGVHDTESGESRRVDDSADAGNTTQTGVRSVRTEGGNSQSGTSTQSGSSVQRSDSTPTGRTTQGQRRVANPEANPNVGGGLFDVGSGTETNDPSGATTQQAGERRPESGGNDTQRPSAATDNSQRLGQRGAGTAQQNDGITAEIPQSTEQKPEVKRGLGTEKVPYRKQSGNPFTLQSLMPAEQADVVKKALEELGDVDQFLVDELGYSSKEELHQALAAEQIDSVAMAIHQMNQGSAFIIGDQTGIGKGRQAAALIRYGVKKGGCPVFITVKKALFSDMYRDLCDIGSPKLRPFIWSADDTEHSGNVTDKNGRVIYQTPSSKEQKRVIDYINKNGKLPPEYDYVLTTYDSFKSGTFDYENGEKKERRFPKGKKPGPVHFNGQAKRDALESLAESSYVIMDESHNAGGEGSNVSNYLQYITTKAKGLTFLSATFAKRPGNMPIYSLKTAISKAGVKVSELIDAVKRGGATFQEIMSKALTEAGQMIRRERDMTGVTIDWRGIEDEEIVQKQREQYDTVIGLFNDIIDFQRTYVDPIVNGMNDDAAEEQGEVDHTPGTRDMGINNTPFASRTYNMVQQVLLSLKAEEAAKRAIEHLKAGRKPVITVANTNEGAADEAAGLSDEAMEMPDLSVNLKKGLQGTMRITKKDAFGNTQNEMIPLSRLSEEGRNRFNEIMEAIENASSGLSLSPIDVIKNELKKAGYKVGELTGRKAEFVYNADGTVRRVKRQDTDKKRIAADFNNGNLDALILNRSAGTGISLHASSTFKDQRQRIMIVAQAQGDVNDEVQIRGRIDRTGQVLRGMYEYVVSQIPSEQRLLMMLKAKLRSLDANTTSSQKSKFNEMQVQDIINKYGDEIVIQYLAEHPDLAMKMCDPLKWGEGAETLSPETLISQAQKPSNGGDGATASKVLGRMALLKVQEQEKMLAEIGDLYAAEIERLNEMGENDLEITEMPLKAKTLKKDVWEEGVEPGGKNPFADNSYVETVEMDVLRKPMKAEEVKKAQERLLGGKTWEEYKQEALSKAEDWAANKKEETRKTITERAEKKATAEKEKYIKGAKKAQEKNGFTDEQIEKFGQMQYDTFFNQEMEKSNNALENVDKQAQAFVDALETFSTDGVYALPTDIYDLTQLTFEPSFGKVIDIDIKEDNYSTAASTITFATLDGRRKITIPVSGMVKQNNGEKRDIKPIIVQQTAQARDGFFGRNIADMHKVLSQNVDNWDRLATTATHKQGHIITGNLLKALTELRKQGKGGKLISYTTDTGDVRQGILMSDQFDPKTLTSKNPISSAKEDLNDWVKDMKIVSADKEVEIRNDGGGWYQLKVPKSKRRGEKYFNDQTLLDLVSGQFEGSSRMAADFRQDNLDAILKRLDELGVTVESSKEEEPKQMITSEDPMEAINQANESWRRENGKPYGKQKEIAGFINRLPERFGLKGGVPTHVINSREELEALKGTVSDRVYQEIEELYNEPRTGAAYIPRAGIVVVFGDKVYSEKEAESTWWHEQTHGFWQRLPDSLRKKYGDACFDYLRRHHKDKYDHIKREYPREDWRNEACSYFIQGLIEEHGTEKILASRFEGIEEICNFANELIDYIKNGKQEREGAERDPLRYGRAVGVGREQGGAQVDRTDSQGRERGRAELRPGEESEVQGRALEDPLEAIEQSAKRWRRDRAESEGMTSEAHSAKAVYDERLNRVETVFSEAYQDSMVSLKTAQNAIAQDKDIPDSQNAYMAENLMHGKNKNEQDLYNKMFRDPLIATINKIMNLTGMNWGDVDRYVYTKSGLERNREFYVRDWLEAQRGKTAPHSYEDLNDAEQSIFDVYAARIEEDFEDGIIATEEEKQKKLSQALQKAHEEYVNQIEQEYLSIKSERYLDLRDNVITFPEYLEAVDSFIRRTIDYGYKAEEHDYSGFRAMFGDEEGKYSEAEIIEELMETEAQMDEGPDGEPSGTVTELWEQIQAATRYGLERYREAGMRSDEQIDQIEQMFHWYVPMRGFKDDTGEDMYQYFTGKGKSKSYVGGLLKHAKGRGSEASYPISTIFAMTYKAISDCNQNLVNQKLYRLCQANPNDLVILSDSWARLNPMTGEWEELGPDITEDMDEEEIREATLAWEEEMRQMASAGNAKKITGKARFDYKPMDKKNQSEHIVDVRINGQPRRMIVTGNPRMAQALNGQLKFEHGRNVFSKWNSYIKNKMATFFTSYSPTFAMRNMFRDWTHFRTMLGVREGHGYASQANKYYRQSLFKMVGLFKKYREGTLDESKEMERDFKDFMDNGGVTGFVFMQKIDDIQKGMEDIYKKQKAGKPIRLNNNLWEKILGAVEALNEGIENNARFATYRASRHYAGRTKARSAYDAKEITVNFNRKGAGGKTYGFKSQSKAVEDAAKAFGVTSQILGEGRIFFNATVQAIATTFKNFQNPDGTLNKGYIAKWAAKYAIPPFMFGLALPAINKALAATLGGDGDDDPYANLAEWTRRKNICIYIGNNNFITIPIGQELAAFLTLGDIAAGMTYAPDLKPVDRTFDQEMVEVMNTFSPVDISTKITRGGLMEDPISEVTGRTFSVLAPLVVVEQNLDWTGRPIYREDKFKNDQYSPEYQMAYSGTNPVLVNASKLLHEIGGGDDVTRGKLEVNPAIIQYLWEQYTGGPGKVFSNTISIGKDAKDILTGNESDFNVRKVEGLKAFVQQGDDRTQFYRANAKYRKYKADAEKLYDAVKGYESGAAENPEYLLKLEQISKGEDFVRMQIVREADKQLSQINKAANKAEGKERKELRRLYNEQVKQVVDMLDSVNE